MKRKKTTRRNPEKYHGWTNYPTWAAYTWITNDERSYNYFTEIAQRHRSTVRAAREIRTRLKKALTKRCANAHMPACTPIY